jgi:prepilin-type N-terminal cleavage/methylation domain-containing protein
MSHRRRGFTLIELLVVVAIIAVLIAILLPSLGRARDQSKTVRCASNMRNVYQASTIYATENSGWFLPAYFASGSTTNNIWSGDNTMGPIFGYRYNPGSSQTGIRLQIGKMLDCPSVDHTWIDLATTKDVNNQTPWEYDYQYNQNLGYNTKPEGSPPVWQNNGGILEAPVLASALPRTTLILTDDRDVSTNHDYVFSSISKLVPPTVGVDQKGQAGLQHKGQTKANLLFADGQILLEDTNKLIDPVNPTINQWVIIFRAPQTSPFPFQ